MNGHWFYRVELRAPVDGVSVFYFRTMTAIYQKFPESVIGCGVRRLWNLKITTSNPYMGRRCSIYKEWLNVAEHDSDGSLKSEGGAS